MLTVKASVKLSKVNGLGLFADEKIKRGTITWKYNPRFDILFSPEEVASMPKNQRDLIENYAYLSTTSHKWVYSIDNSRFTNHSQKHNNLEIVDCGDLETCGIANRDIDVGEELLIDYRQFDANDATSNDEYLND